MVNPLFGCHCPCWPGYTSGLYTTTRIKIIKISNGYEELNIGRQRGQSAPAILVSKTVEKGGTDDGSISSTSSKEKGGKICSVPV